MKTIVAAVICTVLLGLTIAGTHAAEQMPDEMIVAMALSKSVCGGNTGKPCPGQGPVTAPPLTPAPKPSPAPVLPQAAPMTVPQQPAPSSTVPPAPITAVVPSVPAMSTAPASTAVTPSSTGM